MFNKSSRDPRDRKDFKKPLVMPNRKFMLDNHGEDISKKGINLEKTDIFNLKFMDKPYKVYVSTNNQNSYLVNIQTPTGKVIYHSVLDLRGMTTTKTAAEVAFGRIFPVRETL